MILLLILLIKNIEQNDTFITHTSNDAPILNPKDEIVNKYVNTRSKEYLLN